MIEDTTAAERLARAILADITLYNEARVRDAKDLAADLAVEIEEGRTLFRQRVAPELHKVFEDELMVWGGEARDHARRLVAAPIDRGKLVFVVAAVVVFAAVVAWLTTR